MRKWAKILLVMGIVWLTLLIYIRLNYLFSTCPIINCGGPCPGCTSSLSFLAILRTGIPAWIIFIIIAIWGRGKK